MDPEKLKETGLLNSDGEIIEDNIKMVNNEALFPTLKGSVKIQDIATPTVIGSGAKGTIHVEGNRITSYSLLKMQVADMIVHFMNPNPEQ